MIQSIHVKDECAFSMLHECRGLLTLKTDIDRFAHFHHKKRNMSMKVVENDKVIIGSTHIIIN